MVIGKLKKENGKVFVLWLYQFKSENHISKVENDFKYSTIQEWIWSTE